MEVTRAEVMIEVERVRSDGKVETLIAWARFKEEMKVIAGFTLEQFGLKVDFFAERTWLNNGRRTDYTYDIQMMMHGERRANFLNNVTITRLFERIFDMYDKKIREKNNRAKKIKLFMDQIEDVYEFSENSVTLHFTNGRKTFITGYKK